jgi:hypothetical protein
MNIDGDQPAELSGSTESVRDLRDWAGRVMGGTLLRMGLPKAAELDVSIPYVQRLVKNALRTIRQFMPPRE